MEHDEELTELGEDLLRKRIGESHPGAILTRGIFIVEFLDTENEHRGILAVQLGRQGVLQPYEVLGLLAPVQASAQRNMLEMLE